MAFQSGYIKLWRKLKEKGYYQKSQYVHLWVHLLLSANHKPKEFMFNDQIIIIKEGQLITGRKKLAEATGIADTTIERILNHFEKTGRQIEQQKTNKYRLITIINWPKYQSENSKTDNKWTTDGQQTDTNKNVKNDKNDKNIPAPEGAGKEIRVEKDDSRMTPAEYRAFQQGEAEYKGTQVIPLVKWAEERIGAKFPNQIKQRTAISRMLNSGRTTEIIKAKWLELEEDEFWGEKGVDFAVVLSQIAKIRITPKGIPVIGQKK